MQQHTVAESKNILGQQFDLISASRILYKAPRNKISRQEVARMLRVQIQTLKTWLRNPKGFPICFQWSLQTYHLLFMKYTHLLLFVIVVTCKNLHTDSTTVTEQGYYSNSGSSIAGFIFGPILFLLSFPCIWYNEKKLAIDSSRLERAEQICVEVNPYNSPDRPIQNQLVFMTGETSNNTDIVDTISGIRANKSIKVMRNVEVLQWRSTQRDNRTDYNLDWRTTHQSHAGQRMNDPGSWFIKSETFYGNVNLGIYTLSNQQMDLCKKSIDLIATQENIRRIYAYFPQLPRRPFLQSPYIYFSRNGNIEEEGTTRIKFTSCPIGPITIMAQKTSNSSSFSEFNIAEFIAQQTGKPVIKNQVPSCCCCLLSECAAEILKPLETINLVAEEQLSRHQLVAKNIDQRKCFAHIGRIVSFLCMCFGIYLFFTPITGILGYIPLLGGVLQSLVNGVIFLASFLVCIPVFLIVFSLAWLWYHPKVGIPLIILAIVLSTVLIVLAVKYPYILKGQSSAHLLKHHY